MSEEVACGAHGSSPGAIVCRHLKDGERLGFHYDAERDAGEVMCPTAWCDDCHDALEAADEWNQEVVEAADFRLVCSRCYGQIRTRNWTHDHEAFERLLDSSVSFLDTQQEVFRRDFRLGDHERWDWDQTRAQLTFSNAGKVALICDIAFVGSISTASNTWMWAWANDSLEEGVKAGMRELCEYGEEQGFEKLAGGYWDASEEDGWRMTAIAAKFFGAIGAYRTPSDQGFTFMVITGAHWAQ